MKSIAYILLCGIFAVTSVTFAQSESAMGSTENPNPPAKSEATTEEASEEEGEPVVDEKAAKKAANRYWKGQMDKKKKAVSILKKVKDKKSAKKAAKTLAKLSASKKSKDGDKGGRPADSEFMDAAEKRFLPHIEKFDEAIDEEVARIEEIKDWGSNESAMTDDLRAAINALNK